MGARPVRPHPEPEGPGARKVLRDRAGTQGRRDLARVAGRGPVPDGARVRRSAEGHRGHAEGRAGVVRPDEAEVRQRHRLGARSAPGADRRRDRAGEPAVAGASAGAGAQCAGAARRRTVAGGSAGRPAARRAEFPDRRSGRAAVGSADAPSGHHGGGAEPARGQREHRRGARGILPAHLADGRIRHREPDARRPVQGRHGGVVVRAADRDADLRGRREPREPGSRERAEADRYRELREGDPVGIPRSVGRARRARHLRPADRRARAQRARAAAPLRSVGPALQERRRQLPVGADRADRPVFGAADADHGARCALDQPRRSVSGAGRRLGRAGRRDAASGRPAGGLRQGGHACVESRDGRLIRPAAAPRTVFAARGRVERKRHGFWLSVAFFFAFTPRATYPLRRGRCRGIHTVANRHPEHRPADGSVGRPSRTRVSGHESGTACACRYHLSFCSLTTLSNAPAWHRSRHRLGETRDARRVRRRTGGRERALCAVIAAARLGGNRA
ncbi:protein of unknown function [Burkholderia multivorans]